MPETNSARPARRDLNIQRVLDKTGASATTLSWFLHLAASFTGDLRVDG
jgi:hypothetical protein